MQTARITDWAAREAVEFATDEYIYAAQEEERAMDEREEIDRLIDEVGLELPDEERSPAEWRASRRFNDPAGIHRSRRRVERERLALLAGQHPLTAGMPGRGKTSVTTIRAVAEAHANGGEVAA